MLYISIFSLCINLIGVSILAARSKKYSDLMNGRARITYSLVVGLLVFNGIVGGPLLASDRVSALVISFSLIVLIIWPYIFGVIEIRIDPLTLMLTLGMLFVSLLAFSLLFV